MALPRVPTAIVNPPPPEYSHPTRKGPRNSQMRYLHRVVLEALWEHKDSWPFQRPVDAVQFHLPDYYSVIQKPMDLGTIRKRLKHRYYQTASECIEDFETMFSNCYSYNHPGDEVVLMAQRLEELFRQKLSRMPPEERVVGGSGRTQKGLQQTVAVAPGNEERSPAAPVTTLKPRGSPVTEPFRCSFPGRPGARLHSAAQTSSRAMQGVKRKAHGGTSASWVEGESRESAPPLAEPRSKKRKASQQHCPPGENGQELDPDRRCPAIPNEMLAEEHGPSQWRFADPVSLPASRPYDSQDSVKKPRALARTEDDLDMDLAKRATGPFERTQPVATSRDSWKTPARSGHSGLSSEEDSLGDCEEDPVQTHCTKLEPQLQATQPQVHRVPIAVCGERQRKRENPTSLKTEGRAPREDNPRVKCKRMPVQEASRSKQPTKRKERGGALQSQQADDAKAETHLEKRQFSLALDKLPADQQLAGLVDSRQARETSLRNSKPGDIDFDLDTRKGPTGREPAQRVSVCPRTSPLQAPQASTKAKAERLAQKKVELEKRLLDVLSKLVSRKGKTKRDKAQSHKALGGASKLTESSSMGNSCSSLRSNSSWIWSDLSDSESESEMAPQLAGGRNQGAPSPEKSQQRPTCARDTSAGTDILARETTSSLEIAASGHPLPPKPQESGLLQNKRAIPTSHLAVAPGVAQQNGSTRSWTQQSGHKKTAVTASECAVTGQADMKQKNAGASKNVGKASSQAKGKKSSGKLWEQARKAARQQQLRTQTQLLTRKRLGQNSQQPNTPQENPRQPELTLQSTAHQMHTQARGRGCQAPQRPMPTQGNSKAWLLQQRQLAREREQERRRTEAMAAAIDLTLQSEIMTAFESTWD